MNEAGPPAPEWPLPPGAPDQLDANKRQLEEPRGPTAPRQAWEALLLGRGRGRRSRGGDGCHLLGLGPVEAANCTGRSVSGQACRCARPPHARAAPGPTLPAHLNEACAVPVARWCPSPINTRHEEPWMPEAKRGGGDQLLWCRRPAGAQAGLRGRQGPHEPGCSCDPDSNGRESGGPLRHRVALRVPTALPCCTGWF